MKDRMRHHRPRERVSHGNEQVRIEIANYLYAVASYPERFAENPNMTFKQYLFRLVAAIPAQSRRRG
jgi:hypothetical protein